MSGSVGVVTTPPGYLPFSGPTGLVAAVVELGGYAGYGLLVNGRLVLVGRPYGLYRDGGGRYGGNVGLGVVVDVVVEVEVVVDVVVGLGVVVELVVVGLGVVGLGVVGLRVVGLGVVGLGVGGLGVVGIGLGVFEVTGGG